MSAELLQFAYDEARDEYVRPYCPSCLMTIRYGGVELEPGSFFHLEPSCLVKWGGMSVEAQESRMDDAQCLATHTLWKDEPDKLGSYWVRLRQCDLVRDAQVLRVDGDLVVRCGTQDLPRDTWCGYLFQRKAR